MILSNQEREKLEQVFASEKKILAYLSYPNAGGMLECFLLFSMEDVDTLLRLPVLERPGMRLLFMGPVMPMKTSDPSVAFKDTLLEDVFAMDKERKLYQEQSFDQEQPPLPPWFLIKDEKTARLLIPPIVIPDPNNPNARWAY